MMPFAELISTKDIITAAVMGAVMGIIFGVAMLVKYLLSRRSNGGNSVPQPAWTDVTGETRPVLNQECAARHAQLAEAMKAGSAKMAALGESIQEVKTEVIKLQNYVEAGVELRIRTCANETIEKHERGPLHRSTGTSGTYPKAR